MPFYLLLRSQQFSTLRSGSRAHVPPMCPGILASDDLTFIVVGLGCR